MISAGLISIKPHHVEVDMVDDTCNRVDSLLLWRDYNAFKETNEKKSYN